MGPRLIILSVRTYLVVLGALAAMIAVFIPPDAPPGAGMLFSMVLLWGAAVASVTTGIGLFLALGELRANASARTTARYGTICLGVAGLVLYALVFIVRFKQCLLPWYSSFCAA